MVARSLDSWTRAELGGVALVAEDLLQLVVAVEVVLQRALVAAGDHEDVGEPGGDGFLDHILDRRLVDDREHLLGRGLGRGQEAGAQAGCRDDSLADPCSGSSHVPHDNRWLCAKISASL